MVETRAKPTFEDDLVMPVANRHALRTSTQEMHRLSEIRWAEIFEAPQGLDHFLAAMTHLHVALGIRAARRLDQTEAVDLERCRIAALNTDLKVIEAEHTPPDVLIEIGKDEAWGILYALNGSALGATSLLRPGALLAQRPSSYLRLMRDFARSGALATFIRTLNAQALDMARATAGANAVFTAMSQHRLAGKKTK